MSTTLLTDHEMYAKDRLRFSFSRMIDQLGRERAIELEIAYNGEAELAELAAVALCQANRILVAFGKSELNTWPKGWRNVKQGDCDACGQKGYLETVLVGLTFPIEGDFCHKCRGEEIDESEYKETNPLGAVLDLPVWDAGDYWWIETKTSEDAVHLARLADLDVYDEAKQRVLTVREAGYQLDNDEYGAYERFGIVLNEELSAFLTHWTEGLFPKLET